MKWAGGTFARFGGFEYLIGYPFEYGDNFAEERLLSAQEASDMNQKTV
jgi:hypothetical protein